ncbi:uncharacterized protein LOC127723119 isoform X1 [Mytilus californianus]|uniref:uncharacterized protein LOC127723119 isoform X1 n=2 Tax=Mytilus californianus TaxID=6549 RepID=UPI002246A05B|nr:uncharacterized protein LOC127723119 isoform X1 [Mytilus californianus]
MEPTENLQKNVRTTINRQMLTAPEGPKLSRIRLPKINRQARTAPVIKQGHNEFWVSRNSPKSDTKPNTDRTSYSDKYLPPISGYYKNNYIPPTLKLCNKCQHFWRYFRTQELTLMAAVSGENVDLYDVRKTQRRLKVLINVNDVDSPQRYPIRRKPLPQNVCYICSHLDLDGKYQHPHAYLFRKGFFHKCNHHPKTPYPTLIESRDGDHPEDVFNFNKQLSDEELKLSVSVRVKSRREGKQFSPVPIYGQTHFDTSVLNGVQLESHVGESAKFQLPSIFADEGKISGQASLRSSRNSRISDQKSHYSSRQSNPNENWRNNSRNAGSSQNWKNSGKNSSKRSNEAYKINPTISDRSWLEADGYLRNEPEDETFDSENDDEEDKENIDSEIRPKSFSGHEEEKTQESHRPYSESVVSPASSRISRPKGAKRSSDSGNEDEGHLKYHHRSDNESLPHDGFSIASRENSVQTPARSRINSKLSDQELALIGSQISRKNSEDSRALSQSSSSFILQKLAASSMANYWCNCQDIDYTKVKCEECLKIGDHEKWCVHARSSSHQGNCPHCGKPIMKTSKRTSNMSFRGGTNSKQSHHSEEKRVKFEDDDRSREILVNQSKFFDEKLDDGEHDEVRKVQDHDLWTSTENMYENGIDPNIHKKAYLKALVELRMSRLSKINELDESWILDRISKPTFSYFKLRPGQEKANSTNPEGQKNIGLTPDHSHLPSMKNSMKHIFGKNIKVDEFYPGGKKNPLIKFTVKREKKQQTMPIHSVDKSV